MQTTIGLPNTDRDKEALKLAVAVLNERMNAEISVDFRECDGTYYKVDIIHDNNEQLFYLGAITSTKVLKIF